MTLRSRLRRLEENLGPQPAPPPTRSLQEYVQGFLWWLDNQTYNRGVFDEDPEFRPAWSRYNEISCVWSLSPENRGQPYIPLHNIWTPRPDPVVEEARLKVLPIMQRVLRQYEGGVRGKFLEVLVNLQRGISEAETVASWGED
jgi:hypothetical protein